VSTHGLYQRLRSHLVTCSILTRKSNGQKVLHKSKSVAEIKKSYINQKVLQKSNNLGERHE
jgi:hypothetical protein